MAAGGAAAAGAAAAGEAATAAHPINGGTVPPLLPPLQAIAGGSRSVLIDSPPSGPPQSASAGRAGEAASGGGGGRSGSSRGGVLRWLSGSNSDTSASARAETSSRWWPPSRGRSGRGSGLWGSRGGTSGGGEAATVAPSVRDAAAAKVAAEQLQAGAELLFARMYALEACVVCGYAFGVARPCCEAHVCNVCYYAGLADSDDTATTGESSGGSASLLALDGADWLAGLQCPHCSAPVADALGVEALRAPHTTRCQRRACGVSIVAAVLLALVGVVSGTQWQRASRFAASALAATTGSGTRATDVSWFGGTCEAGGGGGGLMTRACFNASSFTAVGGDGRDRFYETVVPCAGQPINDAPPDYWDGSAALAGWLPVQLAGKPNATCLCAATCVTQSCVAADSGGAVGWDIVGTPDDGSAPSWQAAFDSFAVAPATGAPLLDGTPAVGSGDAVRLSMPATLGPLWAAVRGGSHSTGCGAAHSGSAGGSGDALALQFGGDNPRWLATAPLDTHTGGVWSFGLAYGSGTPTCPAAAYGTVVLEAAQDATSCTFDLLSVLAAVAAAGVPATSPLVWDGIGRIEGVSAAAPLPATLGELTAAVAARAPAAVSAATLFAAALPFLHQPLTMPLLSPFLADTQPAVAEVVLYHILASPTNAGAPPLVATTWSASQLAATLAGAPVVVDDDGTQVSPLYGAPVNSSACPPPALCVSSLVTAAGVGARVAMDAHLASLPWRQVATFPIGLYRPTPGQLAPASVVLPTAARGQCMRFRWRQPQYWAAVDAWVLDSVEYARAAPAAAAHAQHIAAAAASLASCCSGCTACPAHVASQCSTLLVTLGAAAAPTADNGSALVNGSAYHLRTRLLYEDAASVVVLLAALASLARAALGAVSLAAACLLPLPCRRRACQTLCLDAPLALAYALPTLLLTAHRVGARMLRCLCRLPPPARVAPAPLNPGANSPPSSAHAAGSARAPPRVPRTGAKPVSQASLYALTAVADPLPPPPPPPGRRASIAARRASAVAAAGGTSPPPPEAPTAPPGGVDEMAALRKAIAYTTAIIVETGKGKAALAVATTASSRLPDAAAAVEVGMRERADVGAAATAEDDTARQAADEYRKRCLARATDDTVQYPGATLAASGTAVGTALALIIAIALAGIVAPAQAVIALLAAAPRPLFPSIASVPVAASAVAVAAAMTPDAGPSMRTFPRFDADYAGPTPPPDEGVFSSQWVLVAALVVDVVAVGRLLIHAAGSSGRAAGGCRALATRLAGRSPTTTAPLQPLQHVASARTDLYAALSDAVLQVAAGGPAGGAAPLRLAALRSVTYRTALSLYLPWAAVCLLSALPFATIAVANAAAPAMAGGGGVALTALALIRVCLGPHALWHGAWLVSLVAAVPSRAAAAAASRLSQLWQPLSDDELERLAATPGTPSRPGSRAASRRGRSAQPKAAAAGGDDELEVLAAHCCGFRARRTAATCALAASAASGAAIAAFLLFWMAAAARPIMPPPDAASGSSTGRLAARMLAHMGVLAPDGRAGSPASMAGTLALLALGLPLAAAALGWLRGACLGLPLCLRIGVVGFGPGALRIVAGEPTPSDVVPGVPACLACGEGRPRSIFAPVPGTCVGRCTPMVDAVGEVGGCRAPGAAHCMLRPNPTRETVVLLLGVPSDAVTHLAHVLRAPAWYAAAAAAKRASEDALAAAAAGPPPPGDAASSSTVGSAADAV